MTKTGAPPRRAGTGRQRTSSGGKRRRSLHRFRRLRPDQRDPDRHLPDGIQAGKLGLYSTVRTHDIEPALSAGTVAAARRRKAQASLQHGEYALPFIKGELNGAYAVGHGEITGLHDPVFPPRSARRSALLNSQYTMPGVSVKRGIPRFRRSFSRSIRCRTRFFVLQYRASNTVRPVYGIHTRQCRY